MPEFAFLKLCYATLRGAVSTAMPNRDYLFHISLWEENKPNGFVFCRNFQFPSCAMLPSDDGFTYWFSQNCMPAAGNLAALATYIRRYFCQNLHFLKYAMVFPNTGFTYWQSQNCTHTAGCLAALATLY